MTPEDVAYLEWLEVTIPQIPDEVEAGGIRQTELPRKAVLQGLALLLAAAVALVAVLASIVAVVVGIVRVLL